MSGGGEEMAAPLAQYVQWSTSAPQADGPHDEVIELQEVLLFCDRAL
jgi:hypothetical protein